MTVHKSQGATLSRAELMVSNAFDYGQAYVAVSAHRPRRKEIAKYLKPVLGKYVWNMRGYFNLKLLFREPHLY
jgi:hypothetical protein